MEEEFDLDLEKDSEGYLEVNSHSERVELELDLEPPVDYPLEVIPSSEVQTVVPVDRQTRSLTCHHRGRSEALATSLNTPTTTGAGPPQVEVEVVNLN